MDEKFFLTVICSLFISIVTSSVAFLLAVQRSRLELDDKFKDDRKRLKIDDLTSVCSAIQNNMRSLQECATEVPDIMALSKKYDDVDLYYSLNKHSLSSSINTTYLELLKIYNPDTYVYVNTSNAEELMNKLHVYVQEFLASLERV